MVYSKINALSRVGTNEYKAECLLPREERMRTEERGQEEIGEMQW